MTQASPSIKRKKGADHTKMSYTGHTRVTLFVTPKITA